MDRHNLDPEPRWYKRLMTVNDGRKYRSINWTVWIEPRGIIDINEIMKLKH